MKKLKFCDIRRIVVLNNTYFSKGNFVKVENTFINDGMKALELMAQFQKQYGEKDIDTVINELHDAVIGKLLGFECVNKEKHGLDCKKDNDNEIYLESKVANWNNKTISAVFNDTTYEKAKIFSNKKVFLALSVWEDIRTPIFVCYGQNEKIGEWLATRVEMQTKRSQRRTQNISLKKLIKEYHFKIFPIEMSKYQLLEKIKTEKSEMLEYITETDIEEKTLNISKLIL